MFKVLVTHSQVAPEALHFLQENNCQLIINNEQPSPTFEEIKAKANNVDAIFWSSTHNLNKEIIETAGPNLKVVGTMSAGYDHIDVQELKSRNIPVSNTPQAVNNSTANCAIMLALAAGRRFLEARQEALSDRWYFTPNWCLGYDLTGSVIGIVGLGGIGQQIAKRIINFDPLEILYSGPREKPEGSSLNAKYVTFDELLKKSHFIFVACPLNAQTKGMFNKEAFAKMRKDAVIVNIARGPIIEQSDLIEALKNKTIFAAGLDVMYPEPLPKDHILFTLPNCVVSPHIGSATYATRKMMALLCAKNIVNGLKNLPLLTPI